MANFSVNQVRHLYVAKGVPAANTSIENCPVGTIEVAGVSGKTLYFKHKGAGGITRTDIIDVDKIMSLTATDSSKLARPLKQVVVSLDASINDGLPIVGSDYILRIAFRQYIGMSDEDQYFKYGAVHITKGMTYSDFYKELAFSLVGNFAREHGPLLRFYLIDDSDLLTEVKTKRDTLNGNYTGLLLTEAEQEWRLGVKSQVPVYFDVYAADVYIKGVETTWGKVDVLPAEDCDRYESTAVNQGTTLTTEIGNGKTIADLEYFCMGDRADLYRQIGWPHNITTQYLVDPTKDYDIIDIHYYYTGNNEGVQKSEKTLTIVTPHTNGNLSGIIAGIEDVTGKTVTVIE